MVAEVVAGENQTVARGSRGKASLTTGWRRLREHSRCWSHAAKGSRWQCRVPRHQMWCTSIDGRSIFGAVAEFVMQKMAQLAKQFHSSDGIQLGSFALRKCKTSPASQLCFRQFANSKIFPVGQQQHWSEQSSSSRLDTKRTSSASLKSLAAWLWRGAQ